MAVVGAALIAVPLLLTMQFAALSNRPDDQLEQALQGSLLSGQPRDAGGRQHLRLAPEPDYWGPNYDTLPEVALTDESFNYLFVGAVPIILLLWFGIAGGGLLRRGRRADRAALLVGAALHARPLHAAVSPGVRLCAGLNLFRRPVDGSFVFVAALRVLRRASARRLRARRLAAAARPAHGCGGGRQRSPSSPRRWCSRRAPAMPATR